MVSDKGAQLTSANNYVTWTNEEDPSNLDWDTMVNNETRKGIEWRFIAAGCQYQNGLAESRVKAFKLTLSHMT